MEDYPPVANNNPTDPKPNRLHVFGFLTKGIFGIGLAAIVCLLLLGMLNYFNILPASNTFPNYLGWLPHRDASNEVPGQTMQKPTENIPANSSVRIPPPPPPSHQTVPPPPIKQ